MAYDEDREDKAFLENRMKENFPRPNKLSPTCELAGFLAYWLSCVVLPSSKQADSVRVSCFAVAGALANGHRYAIAPAVLCSLYRAFGYVISNKDRAAFGMNSAYCGWHFLSGWLGVYFPWVYGIESGDYIQRGVVPLYFFQKRKMVGQNLNTVGERIAKYTISTFFISRAPGARIPYCARMMRA